MKSLTLLALAVMTSAASAANIYINFNGTQAGGGVATDTPFGIDAANWINTGTAVNNSGGLAIGSASLTWTSPNQWGSSTASSGGDSSIYGGYLDDQATTAPSVTISGLLAELGGSDYIVTVYAFAGGTQTIGGHSINGTTASSSSTAVTGGTLGTIVSGTLSGDSVTIAGITDGENAARSGISGISITAVPEPSSTALLGLGGLCLILRRRK